MKEVVRADRPSCNDHSTATKLVDVQLFKRYDCNFPDEELNMVVSPMLEQIEHIILYGHTGLLSDVKSAT
jgi:hypothetical protein